MSFTVIHNDLNALENLVNLRTNGLCPGDMVMLNSRHVPVMPYKLRSRSTIEGHGKPTKADVTTKDLFVVVAVVDGHNSDGLWVYEACVITREGAIGWAGVEVFSKV